jgi:hypothetical protein
MESLKERMAKIVPVTVRRPSMTRALLYLSAAPDGVITSKPTVSPVELPTVVPVMLHEQKCSVAPKIISVADPAVLVYATMKQD